MTAGRLLVLGAASGTQRVELPVEGELTLGRDAAGAIRVDDPSLSRAHCKLRCTPDQVSVADLGSKNGTWLGGRRLAARVFTELPPGTVLWLGDVSALVLEPATRTAACGPLEAKLDALAPDSITVLVLGETGSGKERVARALHDRSGRTGAFVAIHCGALSETLFESELFGHERGAYTGASGARPGLLELASGGTVFLDEIGEVPSSMQVKLLRVLEDRRVRRVGARTEITLDVRFVAATNRELEDEIGEGRFRADLFFRLSGVVLRVPPLRERKDELPALAQSLLAEACALRGRPVPSLDPEVLEALLAHDWPGNIRELRNVVVRALLASEGEHLSLECLPPLTSRRATSTPSTEGTALPSPRPAQTGERERIVEALRAAAGNQTAAASALGISRRTLLHWLDRHGIERPRKAVSEKR